MRAVTWTMVDAGRTSAKTSPCARPTASQSRMSVTNIRVRTTSAGDAPHVASASTTISSATRACS